MEFNYIENPVINKKKIKEFVYLLIKEGVPNKWAILVTSQDKTEKEYRIAKQKVWQYRNRYPFVEWAVHIGEKNYSIICRKVESK